MNTNLYELTQLLIHMFYALESEDLETYCKLRDLVMGKFQNQLHEFEETCH